MWLLISILFIIILIVAIRYTAVDLEPDTGAVQYQAPGYHT